MRGYFPGDREYRKPPVAGAGAAGAGAVAPVRARSGRRLDWVVGILLGLVLGVSVVVALLLLGSEGTIDAPSIHGAETGKPPPAQTRPAEESRESR